MDSFIFNNILENNNHIIDLETWLEVEDAPWVSHLCRVDDGSSDMVYEYDMTTVEGFRYRFKVIPTIE